MQRTIKFRAIIPERNATIYFDLSDLVHPAIKDLFSKREILIPWLLAGNKPDEYTGLKDKNGVEIYEGDLLRASPYLRYVVIFRNGSFAKIHMPDDGWMHYMKDMADNKGQILDEVIGTIYENPELLEVK